MPGQPVVLDTLGGLVATCRPEDVPEGASPRTYDTDFIVGRVIQRAGLQNVYSYQGISFGPNGGGRATNDDTQGNPWLTPANILANDGSFTASTVSSSLTTDTLVIDRFNFVVPSTSAINGIVVRPKGFCLVAGTTIFAQLTKAGVPVGNVYSETLATSNGFVTLGGQTDGWGESWLYSDIDGTGFGVTLWAVSSTAATIALDYCEIIVYGSDATTNFLGLMSANLNSTDLTTLALDALGLIWAEDATNAPNVLVRAGLIPPVVPGSYMKGVDANGVAYMAYSDLTQGTSQPMQFNGQWCDRITQVGPGSSPVFTPQQASADVFYISTITQPPDMNWGFAYGLQSVGPGSNTAGTVVTIYYADSTLTGPDTALETAFNSGNAVYLYQVLTNAPTGMNTPLVVQVTSVGLGAAPDPVLGPTRPFYYYTYNVPTVASLWGSGHGGFAVNYQQTLATLTASVPIPGLEVGNRIVVSAVTPSAWNSTWTITQAINSGAIAITQTSVASGTATYNYTLISGVAPTASQLITITNTLNANGTLNGANLLILSATGGASGSFTVNVPLAPDAGPVAESGQGVTAGTIFAFDPGSADVGTATNPIFGNGTGGTLTFSAATATFITPGIKQGTIFWITRNGAVTQPANPVTFAVPSNTESISATLIPTGPPNVEFIGFAFTESGQNEVPGANFYTYDTAVTFTVNGTKYVASALIVPNGTTSALFSFPDSVLLASDEIDIQGNNYFNLREIGSPAWMFQYANRMMYGLCQTKLDNLVNLTFDGGFLPAANPQPLGWTPLTDPNITAGLVNSPDFGNSLQILNTGSGMGTVTAAYLYYQTAYQDFYNVPILQPNVSYSVRLKARALNFDGQHINIALVPSSAGVFGSAIGLAGFTVDQGDFTIQTQVLLTEQTSILPSLQLAIQVGSLVAGAGIQIDRIEIFPTNHPVDTTTIWTSYVDKFESVDRVTGQLGCGADNPQPAQGAEQILEQLYIHKTSSKCVTQDSPNYEPNQWNVPLASQGVGAIGPNAFYSDEEFDISVCRSGTFLFDGGKPMPISQELQSTGTKSSLWDIINWAAGKTIWCRFSTEKRQLFIGVPMITPNFWLPNAPSATPTMPNVVIMCNFNGCPTAEEFAASDPVHVTMFGDLKAIDMRRKWSLWQMSIPAAEFIARQDGYSFPLFLCNGADTSKIYQLIDGAPSGGQNTDDGNAINWLYTTYAFVKTKQGQQVPGLGALRKVWYYFAATMEGVGQVARKFYSNTLGALAQNTYTAPPATLTYPAQNDQECVLEIGGQRLFVEFSAVGSGGYAEIGPVMLDGEVDKNAPHRGVSA